MHADSGFRPVNAQSIIRNSQFKHLFFQRKNSRQGLLMQGMSAVVSGMQRIIAHIVDNPLGVSQLPI